MDLSIEAPSICHPSNLLSEVLSLGNARYNCQPKPPTSKRRYEYIQLKDGRMLGENGKCHKQKSIESWTTWLFSKCNYCMCLCDAEGKNSDRYVNLRPSISNIPNNKVVIGIRFQKVNRIIHLQIQEGKLMPNGEIDSSTIRWIPLNDYRITDRKVYSKQDYHKLSYTSRIIYLDELIAEHGTIVTGVRFKLLGQDLNLEILITPFHFETGKLKTIHDSYWYSNKNILSSNDAKTTIHSKPRSQVQLLNPKLSTRSPKPSERTSKHNQYVQFTNTNFEDDVAQSTVPFFDAQNVESSVPVPLQGIGLLHKGIPGYGGFITPSILSYDFGQTLNIDFPNIILEKKLTTLN